MRLAKNSSAPFTCDAARDSSIALTANYSTCICRSGTGWVKSNDGYSTCVWSKFIGIVLNGSSRNWADGSYARSCYVYKNPPSGSSYQYAGDIGDGVYAIDPDGAAGSIAPFNVTCDMTTENGGWTYYPVANGLQTYRYTDNNSCKSLGMDIVMPRSKSHWDSMFARYDSTYFATVPGVYKTADGGNYASCIMRNPVSYSPGCNDWRVGDGGRWWLRDATYAEPSGDYLANCWLSQYKFSSSDIQYNDGNCNYSTTKYICSTNDKP